MGATHEWLKVVNRPYPCRVRGDGRRDACRSGLGVRLCRVIGPPRWLILLIHGKPVEEVADTAHFPCLLGPGLGNGRAKCRDGLSLGSALRKTYIKAANTRRDVSLFSCSSASSANLKSTFLFFPPCLFVFFVSGAGLPFYLLIYHLVFTYTNPYTRQLHHQTSQLPVSLRRDNFYIEFFFCIFSRHLN